MSYCYNKSNLRSNVWNPFRPAYCKVMPLTLPELPRELVEKSTSNLQNQCICVLNKHPRWPLWTLKFKNHCSSVLEWQCLSQLVKSLFSFGSLMVSRFPKKREGRSEKAKNLGVIISLLFYTNLFSRVGKSLKNELVNKTIPYHINKNYII